MGSRSGGGKIINWRKVKSGYDQEFTLPKGSSAAPIKQVKVTTEVQRVKAQIAKDKLTPKVKESKGKIVGKVSQNYGEWKPVYQKIKTNPKPVKNTEVPVIIPKGTKMVTIKPYTQKQGWTPVGGKSGEGLGVYKVTRGTHKGKTVVIPTYKVPASNVKKILKDLYKWK